MRYGLRAGVAIVTAVVVVLVVVLAAVQVRNLIPGLQNPFAPTTVDRSGPAVLLSVRDLSRYDAAAGDYQVIVDLQREAPFVPPEIIGARTLFVGVGTVDAYVDFSSLADNAVTVSSDRKAARIRVPHAALDRPNLDPQHSYVFADQQGIVDRLQAVFSQSPQDQSQLYQLASRKIAAAAAQSGLTTRADTNTRAMLEGLLRALGYQQVTITYS